MSYQIHFIGQEVKEVKDRKTAMYHLAAMHGALVYNIAVNNGVITIKDEYCIVRPGFLKKSH